MLGTLTFPADSAAAVAGNFGRIAPVPDFMKLIGPYVRSSIEGGISTISIYECDDARADEAVDYLTRRYAPFADIQGVTANIEEWLGVDVVLQLLDETQSVTAALEAVSFRF